MRRASFLALLAAPALLASAAPSLAVPAPGAAAAERRVASSSSAPEAEPARSADEEPPRGELVYAVSHAGRGWLEVVSLDGTGTRRLTPVPQAGTRRRDVAPAWSPDGRRVAFVRLGAGRASGVHVIGRAGGTPRRVLALAPDAAPDPPIWSPTGARLALNAHKGQCTTARPFPHRLTVVRADGRGAASFPALPQARRLTVVELVGWSPDGGRLLFLAYRLDDLGFPGECRWHAPSSQLWTIRRDGTGRRRLAAGNIYSAEWSPDGSRVAFVACGLVGCRLELVRADGTGRRAAGIQTSAWAASWTWLSPRELLVLDNVEEEHRWAAVVDVERRAVRVLARWPPSHCAEGTILAQRRPWAAVGCTVGIKLLETATGREVDLPSPVRPRLGTVSGLDARLVS